MWESNLMPTRGTWVNSSQWARCRPHAAVFVVSVRNKSSSVSHTDTLNAPLKEPLRHFCDRCCLCVVMETNSDITNHLEGKGAIGCFSLFVILETTVNNPSQRIPTWMYYVLSLINNHIDRSRLSIVNEAWLMTINSITPPALHMKRGGSCFLTCAVGWKWFPLNSFLQSIFSKYIYIFLQHHNVIIFWQTFHMKTSD